MNTKTTLRRRAAALGLALIMCAACAVPASAAEDATAAAMRLTKTTGTVDVTNSRGRELSLRDDMRLYSGYHVETQETSYAWISLDNTKLTKLDAVSELEVRKSGKELELLLNSGQLYFNVTEPLNSDESLSIRTSTMVTGIRGTSGWVRVVDQWHTQVYVLQGRVECSVTDPVTGQTKTTLLTGGDMAECVVYEQVRPGDKCDIIRKGFTEEDAGGFIQVELAPDKPHRDRIEADSGLVFPDSLEKAEDRLKQDETDTHEKLQPIEDSYSHQDHTISKDPVWEENLDNDDSGDSDSGGSDPAPVQNIRTFTMQVTDNEVDAALAEADVTGVRLVPNPATTDMDNDMLVIDSGITVPAGKTLTLEAGVPMFIQPDQTLQVDGTATVTEYINNNGTIEVTSSNTLNANGTLYNNGSLFVTATGRAVVAGTFESTGTVQNKGTLTVGSLQITGGADGGPIEFSNSGTFTGSVTNAGPGDISISGGTTGRVTVTGGGDTLISGGTVDALDSNGYVQLDSGRVNTMTLSQAGAEGTALAMDGGIIGKLEYGADCSTNILGGEIEQRVTLGSGELRLGGTAKVDSVHSNGCHVQLQNSAEITGECQMLAGSLTMPSGVIRGGLTTDVITNLEGGEIHGGINALTNAVVQIENTKIYAADRNNIIRGKLDAVKVVGIGSADGDVTYSSTVVIIYGEENGETILRGAGSDLGSFSPEPGDCIVLMNELTLAEPMTLSGGTAARPVTLELNASTLHVGADGDAVTGGLTISGNWVIDGSAAGSAVVFNAADLGGQNGCIVDNGASLVLHGGAYSVDRLVGAGGTKTLMSMFHTSSNASLFIEGGAAVNASDLAQWAVDCNGRQVSIENATVSGGTSCAIEGYPGGAISVLNGATVSSSGTEGTICLVGNSSGAFPILTVAGGIVSFEGTQMVGPAVCWRYNNSPQQGYEIVRDTLKYTSGGIRTMAGNMSSILCAMTGGSSTPSPFASLDGSGYKIPSVTSTGYTYLDIA